MNFKIIRDFPDISLKTERLAGFFDFKCVFGRPGKVHIEIGSGKGTFLLSQARENPDINFLGIEWANKYYRHAVDRMGRWDIKNVRLIRDDAAVLIAEHLGDETVECFHVYFPDPWPKKRHHKRRFLCQKNLDQLLRCLEPEGSICIATDHAEYFEAISELLANNTERLENEDFSPTAGAETGERVGTNFERKYIQEGRPIYTAVVRKIK